MKTQQKQNQRKFGQIAQQWSASNCQKLFRGHEQKKNILNQHEDMEGE